jgi:hydrogenase nickel incorporation protein HypB
MGITQEVLDAVLDACEREGAVRVNTVRITIGELTEIFPDAMEFAWEALRRGTIASEAELVIRTVGAKSRCLDCDNVFAHDKFDRRCTACGSVMTWISSRKALPVEIDLSRPILAHNDRIAERNRAAVEGAGVFMLDVLASPGAGKTTTILATIAALRDRYRIAVIEGDIASRVDADKVAAQGVPAVQINTGGACHLDAGMISRALEALDLDSLDLVIVENVGNLVCPTEFDLGHTARIVILSVPEGHDKPLKYPGVFGIADAVVLSKIDTLPVFDFDEGEFDEAVARLNGRAPRFRLSARTGEGMAEWVDWVASKVDGSRDSGVARDTEGS